MLTRDGRRHRALQAKLRARGFQRQFVEPARLRIERGIDARDLVVMQHVGRLALDRVDALVIRRLEGVEGAHHFRMRHHSIRRKAGLAFEGLAFEGFGFEDVVYFHKILLVNG